MLKFNSNEPIKVSHLQKLANQSILNGALEIEIVNNSFSESKKSLDNARDVLVKKTNRDMGSEKYISTRFR